MTAPVTKETGIIHARAMGGENQPLSMTPIIH
jgi:hypothetical protein